MNANVVDIASLDVATKVDQFVNTEWYASILQAMQKEAERLGYTFVKTESTAILPPIVAERLAFALCFQRESFQSPLEEKSRTEKIVGRLFLNGFAQQLFTSMMGGLSSCGVGLEAGADAHERVLAEIAHRDGTWIRHAFNLLAAMRTHADLATATQASERIKNAIVQELLDLDGFDSDNQLICYLRNHPHDSKFEKGWLDAKGAPTMTCPDVVSLTEPLMDMSDFELRAIIALAREKFSADV